MALGAGAKEYEDFLQQWHDRYPREGGFYKGYSGEPLAHQIEAGADIFLMPSLYEPCGLNQMYSMRYGTVPLVRATGGLDDTVEQFNPSTGTGTGFVASDTDNLTVQGTGNTITTATGIALSLTDVEVGSAGVRFESVTATGGTNAVYLEDVTGGTVTLNGGNISGTSGDAIAVVGGANLAVANMTISAGGAGDGIDVGLTTNYGHMVACIVPGLALRGSHVNFEFGLGYGSWWLPIVELPLPFAGLVPDMNFNVVF
jgi:hypothetical protein